MRESVKFVEKLLQKSNKRKRKRKKKEHGNVLARGKQLNVCRDNGGMNRVLYSDMHLMKAWLGCDSSEHVADISTVPVY
jgi:hypothetical protein